MDIRSIIEDKINKAGITKKELCKRCDIQHANNINAMLSAPSWPTLEKFAKALGISVSELVSDEPQSQGELTIKCDKCGNVIKIKEIKTEQ